MRALSSDLHLSATLRSLALVVVGVADRGQANPRRQNHRLGRQADVERRAAG